MKKTLLLLAFFMPFSFSFAQEEEEEMEYDAGEMTALIAQLTMQDSLAKSLDYKTGTVSIGNNLGTLKVPKGLAYLSPEDARTVLVELWGNPSDLGNSLGMLVPKDMSILNDSVYVFSISFDPMGYVEDDDADDIDYDDLLKDLKAEAVTESEQRRAQGYPGFTYAGWAASPYYDNNRKVLHWAQELLFDEDETSTLNYNIRILGRKGVLVMNAIAGIRELPLIEKDIPKILDAFSFNEGERYEDFDSNIDEVAAWTVGGLVAGKILAKAGLWVFILKFWKIILIAVGGGGAALWSKMRGKKEETPPSNELNS